MNTARGINIRNTEYILSYCEYKYIRNADINKLSEILLKTKKGGWYARYKIT